MAAVALFKHNFVVELRGTAKEALSKAPQATNEIYGIELSATVAAARSLGDQPRGKKLILFPDTISAAGALVKASGRVPIFLATMECAWAIVAQTSKSRWIERAQSKANAPDAIRSGGSLDSGIPGETGTIIAPAGVTAGSGSRSARYLNRQPAH